MLVDGDNAKKAFFYFTAKGLTAAQAAGIVGNLLQESGVNPKSVQRGGPGRGIAQWSAGDRWDGPQKDSLKNWAGGKDIYNLATQLDFMWHEMNQVSPWKLSLQGSKDPHYPSLKDITGDTRQAAVTAGHSFGYLYERFGIAGARDRFAGDTWAKYHSESATTDASDSQAGCAATAADGTCPNAPPGWVQVTNKVVQVACDEWNKHVVEDAGDNCDKADNIAKYAKATGYGHCGLSWCGMFLGYVYKTAGVPFPASAHVGSVPAVYSYLGSVGARRNPATAPKPGDVVTYGQEHEGVVVGVDGKYVTTIEGNTGPDPQDRANTSHLEGVHMHRRTHPFPAFPQSAWGDVDTLSAKQTK